MNPFLRRPRITWKLLVWGSATRPERRTTVATSFLDRFLRRLARPWITCSYTRLRNRLSLSFCLS